MKNMGFRNERKLIFQEVKDEMSSTPFTRSIPSHELYMPLELDEVENSLKYVAER